MSKVLIAYIPVLHAGYLNFLEKYRSVDTIYLLSSEILASWPNLRKDVRALAPEMMAELLRYLSFGATVDLLTAENLNTLTADEIIMPDEEIMHELATNHFAHTTVTFDRVFLRWDSKKSQTHEQIEKIEQVSEADFDQQMMQKAQEESQKSADWWRQVGAVLIKDGRVALTAHNHHVPDPQQAYYDGDPRADFHKGDHIDLSTAMHAEAEIITKAAQIGISTQDCELYVTTFPCPVCAKLVAYSGIKKVFFRDGYSMVHGAELLKDQNIQLIKVKPATKE